MDTSHDQKTQPQVTRSVELDGDTDEVWRLLTDDDERSTWFGGESEIDVRPGGQGHVVDPDGTCRMVEVDRVDSGRRLGWRWWPEAGGAPPEVEFVIEPARQMTRLTVTERRVSTGELSACASGRAVGRLLDLELLVLTRMPVHV